MQAYGAENIRASQYLDTNGWLSSFAMLIVLNRKDLLTFTARTDYADSTVNTSPPLVQVSEYKCSTLAIRTCDG